MEALALPVRGFPTARRLVTAHWGLLIVCAGFLLAGALVFDDYGISWDAPIQRGIGNAALDYLAGEGERAFNQLRGPADEYYGAVLEAPLVLVERLLGLEDSRDVYLSRHLLTHLFFLAGGVFCYLLVLRMFGNRLLALAAMVLFLLHPRLYAHSFFNSKDVPFAAMFMVALYLTHRAFRRDTLAAFLLCGVGVGLLVNLRVMGIVLFFAVLALRGLDLLFAGSAKERKGVLLTGGAFALTAALTYHASLPVLWADPGQFLDVLRAGATHPHTATNFFRGEWFHSRGGLPFEYIPVWIGISTPPIVLLCAMIGVIGLVWRGARRPWHVWRATPLRFGILLALLIVVPVIAVLVVRSTVYDQWRQVYFLYTPFALLALLGLRWALEFSGNWRIQSGIYVLALAGIAVTIVSMTRIHPLQSDYFNSLVNRNGAEWLASQYQMNIWNSSDMKLIREVLEDHPGQELILSNEGIITQALLLSEGERKRISRISRKGTIFFRGILTDHPPSQKKYVHRIYGSTIPLHTDVKPPEIDNPESIIDRAVSTNPVFRSTATIYRHGKMFIFLREDCSPEDIRGFFSVNVYPVDVTVLSGREKAHGDYEPILVNPYWRDVVDDSGRCAWIVILPPYPVASVYANQYTDTETLWGVRFGVTLPEVDPAVLASAPIASSTFDVYRDGDSLVYVKDPCADDDMEAVFGMNVYPLDPVDLPADRKRDRFNALTFRFWDNGVRVGDRCVVVVPLPDYPVAGVQTGQQDYEGWIWDVNFGVMPPQVDMAVLAREPLARSDFAVYRDGDALVYVKDGCTEEDAGAAFFLHVYPIDPSDLPADRRQYGFDNRDFFLWQYGGRAGERCVAVVALPDYPIASVVTGQYDETGQLWVVEFALPE